MSAAREAVWYVKTTGGNDYIFAASEVRVDQVAPWVKFFRGDDLVAMFPTNAIDGIKRRLSEARASA